MQKTRFDDQEPSNRAAARPSRMLAGVLFCAAIATAGCMETRKATGGHEVNENQVFVRSPEGAVPPKGLELVEIGMSMSEVEVKLGKMYEINRVKRDEEEDVFTDTFSYTEERELKITRIYYRNGKVYYISFGFPYFN